MTHGRDADFLALLYECADHARTGVGFSGTGRALDGEDRFVQKDGNALCSRDCSLAIR